MTSEMNITSGLTDVAQLCLFTTKIHKQMKATLEGCHYSLARLWYECVDQSITELHGGEEAYIEKFGVSPFNEIPCIHIMEAGISIWLSLVDGKGREKGYIRASPIVVDACLAQFHIGDWKKSPNLIPYADKESGG